MNRRVYRDYNFLNSTFDDRGILVRMTNESMLSTAFIKVAEAKSREVQILKNEKFKPELERWKEEKKRLTELRKQMDKSSPEFAEYEKNVYVAPYSRFRVLTTSIKQYELLSDIDLIIHVTSQDRKTMEDIYENVYNLTFLGRSEGFVEVKEAKRVTLCGCDEELESAYPAYVTIENVRKRRVFTKDKGMNG